MIFDLLANGVGWKVPRGMLFEEVADPIDLKNIWIKSEKFHFINPKKY